ncbi:MAG: hypothetical protein EA353_03810 [Puniceicoccaceae bacterium]|nr:MAG: hypothetical protein EA353_03810 [Puniceicoccaceae bacterium]
MNLSTAVPFDEALQRFDRRTPLGSSLRTEGWARAPMEIREAAFFSAAVESERTLSEMKSRISDDLRLNPEVRFNGKSGFVADMRRSLGAGPGDTGRLTDITSRRRLELIYQMNVAEAYEFGRHKQSQSPALLEAFPARELIREASREAPREWQSRWAEAGGSLYGGRMIALVNDPIWTAISRFGRPYPPFDFGSGMGTRDIERDEAERLGVIAPGEMPPAEDPGFNDLRQASIRGLAGDAIERLSDLFGAELRSDGGKLATISSVSPGDLYDRARQGERFKSTAYEIVTPAQAAAMAQVTGGTDLSRYRHSVDSSALDHVRKEHGNPVTEAARGQLAITRADFDKLPEITRNISEVRDAGIDQTLKLQRIASISPSADGTYYMIEEVRSPKKGHLSLVTLMKFEGQAPRANPQMRRANVQNAPDTD